MSTKKSFYEVMEKHSLTKRIYTLRMTFSQFVDSITVWYVHNQNIKAGNKSFLNHPDYKLVELSNKEKQKAIEELEWFKRDLEACIEHLKR